MTVLREAMGVPAGGQWWARREGRL
jgi:hypothetical protein